MYSICHLCGFVNYYGQNGGIEKNSDLFETISLEKGQGSVRKSAKAQD